VESVVSQHIQDSFVFLTITKTKFLTLVRQSVKPEYFSSPVTEAIIHVCYSFYDQFKKAPKDHLFDELQYRIENKSDDEKELYYKYLDRISNMELPNEDYVIRKISNFIKAREFETAAIEFVQKVEYGKFDEARTLMQHALKAGIEKEELGIDYLNNLAPTYYKDDDDRNILLPTGIEEIDSQIEGLKRGQFVCILGGYKGKKSWFQIYLAKMGLLKGLNILYLSHEMKAEEVEMRLDMSIGGLVSSYKPKQIKFPETDKEGIIIREIEKEVNTVHANQKNILRIRKRAKRFGGKIIIKKYPMGTCSISEMDRFLDYLETYHNFVPDVLINDYIDIMNLPLTDNSSHRDRINRAYIEHKRIADERNILVLTASQITRSALRKKRITQQDFAEDIRKMGNVDLAIATSQDNDQAQENVMLIWILANRSGKQDCGCLIRQNIDIGQYCTDSWPLYSQD